MNFLKLSAFCLFEKKRRDGKVLYMQYISRYGTYDILPNISEEFDGVLDRLFENEGYLILQANGD